MFWDIEDIIQGYLETYRKFFYAKHLCIYNFISCMRHLSLLTNVLIDTIVLVLIRVIEFENCDKCLS